jgi:hypothetical protein
MGFGLATAQAERIVRTIDVARVRITEAGRRAILCCACGGIIWRLT